MDYRVVWTDADFADMGWHDATIYSMSFPQANYLVIFDIDYIFEWHWDAEEVRGWDVAPCRLQFDSVSNLKVALSWGTRGDTSIQNIIRSNCWPTPNGKSMQWDYVVETDSGNISFTATGFTQTVLRPPIFSTFQSLERQS